MEKEKKKLNALLNFYRKEEIVISLRMLHLQNTVIRGNVIKRGFIPQRYFVLKGKDKESIMFFLEDILPNSIIPFDYEKKENKNNRSPLSKSLRHKILKRDRFTCQACGARAPDVELEVDHKIPVSKGGTDDESNLTTLCVDCNRGKRDKV